MGWPRPQTCQLSESETWQPFEASCKDITPIITPSASPSRAGCAIAPARGGLPVTPCIYQSRGAIAVRVDEDLDAHLFLQQKQEALPCCSSYLATTQAGSGVTAGHRATVIDRMVAAASALGLHTDSLFTAVACLDRYLSVQATPLDLVQPVGIACLWLGAKYEQLVTPRAACFASCMLLPASVPLTGTAAAQQLLIMLEGKVLQALDYKLASIVTVKAFSRRIMQLVAGLREEAAAAQAAAAQAAAAAAAAAPSPSTQQQQQQQQQEQQLYTQLYFLTSYLSEVCLLEYQLLPYLPSQLAAAAFCFAHILLGMALDGDLIQQLTRHSLAELKAPMQWLCALHATLSSAESNGRPYSVSMKYGRAQLGHVARVPPVTNSADPRLNMGKQAEGC